MSEKTRLAEAITVNTRTGDIDIDGMKLPFYTHEDGPTIELIGAGLAWVAITFITENVHLIGGGKELKVIDNTADWYDDDPIGYIRAIGAREKADALAWLTRHVAAIYEDLGLTREMAQ